MFSSAQTEEPAWTGFAMEQIMKTPSFVNSSLVQAPREEKEKLRKLKLLHTPEIQSFPIHKVTLVPERESLRAKLVSSKMVKRSRSFNRIFSYSMLGRSKEYRL